MSVRGRRPGSIPGILLAVCFGISCSSGTPPASTVADSGGVRIVTSSSPRWDGTPLALSSSPRLELAADMRTPETALYQVTGVAVLPDGRVAVANRGDGSVRLYDTDGDLLWTAGREGDGPGEFRDLRGVVLLGGQLWAFQSLPRPIQVFDLTGQFVRTHRVPELSGPSLRGILADGSVVATTRPTGSSDAPVFDQVAAIVRHRGEVMDTLTVLPANRRVNTSVGPEWQALGPTMSVTASGTRVYAGFSGGWGIDAWDASGRLIQRIRRAWEPVPIVSAHEAAYSESLTQGAQPGLEDAYRRLAEEMIYPSSHPAFARVLSEMNGTLWVERAQTEPPWTESIDYNRVRPDPSEWDLFSPDGRWLGTISIPARFRVMAVGPDYVAGVAKDELDIETVQVWAYVRPS